MNGSSHVCTAEIGSQIKEGRVLVVDRSLPIAAHHTKLAASAQSKLKKL
jgi:hypothetical protein